MQHLLEQARKACQEKDELIARLQAGAAIRGNMIVDGAAYFLKKENILDGPYCLSCFQQNHETTRLVPAPKPKGADGPAAAWVQCPTCQAPFRSDRLAEFLSPRQTAPTPTSASAQGGKEEEPARATRKSPARNREAQAGRPERAKMSVRAKRTP